MLKLAKHKYTCTCKIQCWSYRKKWLKHFQWLQTSGQSLLLSHFAVEPAKCCLLWAVDNKQILSDLVCEQPVQVWIKPHHSHEAQTSKNNWKQKSHLTFAPLTQSWRTIKRWTQAQRFRQPAYVWVNSAIFSSHYFMAFILSHRRRRKSSPSAVYQSGRLLLLGNSMS